MRITMVLPFRAMTGGTKVMVEYANRLAARGHDVVLVYPWYHTAPRGLAARLKGPAKGFVNAVARAAGTSEIRWADVAVPLRCVRRLDEAHLPDADILIATENQTIEPLSSVSPRKGRKVYLIQGYETWGGRTPREVEATWQESEWMLVAVSGWLRALIRERAGHESQLVPNGIDVGLFRPLRSPRAPTPRVLAVHSPLRAKGTAVVLDALDQLRSSGLGFQPVFFGFERRPRALFQRLPDVIYHHAPSARQLRDLYRLADVFISGSLSEGFGLTPLEAMACGCAVVATSVGAIPDYGVDEKTLLLAPPGSSSALAAATERLLREPSLRRCLGQAAARHASGFSLDSSVTRFETILRHAASSGR
ncbi:MAG: glycosyltransferase family 4 protein [Longimicrobiales bacterium]